MVNLLEGAMAIIGSIFFPAPTEFTLPPSSPDSIESEQATLETPVNEIDVCQEATYLIQCKRGNIKIHAAVFGVYSNSTTCGIVQFHDEDNKCLSNRSTQIVRDICDDKRVCLVHASTTIFGDPCPNLRSKMYLLLVWRCDSTPCHTHYRGWSHVITNPKLPVNTNDEVELICTEGYTNAGGKNATCMSGQIVQPAGESPPECHAQCTEWDPLLESHTIVTDSILPVDHGTELNLFCSNDTYNMNIGGERAMCNDGKLLPHPTRGVPLCRPKNQVQRGAPDNASRAFCWFLLLCCLC